MHPIQICRDSAKFSQVVTKPLPQQGIFSIVVVTTVKSYIDTDCTFSNAGCITVVANFRAKADFSGDLGGFECRFSGVRNAFSPDLMERETVRTVSISPTRRLVFMGLAIMASFEAVRGRIVRFLSLPALLRSIRRRA